MLNRHHLKDKLKVFFKYSHLIGVENRGFGDESLHAAHAAVHHVDGDLADLGGAVLLAEGLDLLLEGRDLGLEGGLEVVRGMAHEGGVGQRSRALKIK